MYNCGAGMNVLMNSLPLNEETRPAIWKPGSSTRLTYELSPEAFVAIHEGDIDTDFPNMFYWYREELDPNTYYPVGVNVESPFNKAAGIVPIGDKILTLRRICNLLVRARFRCVEPGKYQIRWIFWFPAGRSCPPSHRPIPSCYVPTADSTENSVLQRLFPSVGGGMAPPNPNEGFFYPWSLLLHAGQPKTYSEFMEASIDVTKHSLAAPELLQKNFVECILDQGLWNTKRNTGWCEITGGIVEVNDSREIALMISQKFERRWYGGFSFGGVKLVRLS